MDTLWLVVFTPFANYWMHKMVALATLEAWSFVGDMWWISEIGTRSYDFLPFTTHLFGCLLLALHLSFMCAFFLIQTWYYFIYLFIYFVSLKEGCQSKIPFLLAIVLCIVRLCHWSTTFNSTKILLIQAPCSSLL
jgi:hypothetical protein